MLIRAYCVETNVVYLSALEAQKQLGIAQSSICAVCKGKQKTKGKYTFTPKTTLKRVKYYFPRILTICMVSRKGQSTDTYFFRLFSKDRNFE